MFRVAMSARSNIGPHTAGTRRGRLVTGQNPGSAKETATNDWQLVRADGSIEVDGRYTARGADGSLLYLHAVGVRSGDPAVLEALLRGDAIDPSEYYLRVTVTIESAAHPEFERSLFVASYVREADRVRYVAYRVT